jgi:hypothetical protein
MRRGKVLVKVLACLFLLPVSASFVLAQPANVQKTGYTNCSTNGEDGCYKKGVAWPNPRFTNNGDGTVTDNLTGLMWTEDANLFGAKTWAEAINACEILELGANGCNIYTDWRLPNLFELESLRDMKYFVPALSNSAGTGQWKYGDPFINLWTSGNYWSSTTYASYTYYAWDVFMYDGYVGYGSKSNSYYVWPVRGGND